MTDILTDEQVNEIERDANNLLRPTVDETLNLIANLRHVQAEKVDLAKRIISKNDENSSLLIEIARLRETIESIQGVLMGAAITSAYQLAIFQITNILSQTLATEGENVE